VMQSPELLVIVLDARVALIEDAGMGNAAVDGGPDNGADSVSQPLLPQLWMALQGFVRAFDLLVPEQQVSLLAVSSKRVTLLADTYADRVDWVAAKQKLSGLLLEAGALNQPGHVSVALTKALCIAVKRQSENHGFHARVLVVEASSTAEDLLPQTTGLVNAAFAAQGRKIPIDCLSLGTAPSIVLQQAASLTDGRHHVVQPILVEDGKPQHSAGSLLLPSLLVHFLPGVKVRAELFAPKNAQNLSAVCACHGKVKELAFVCSCCLAVFCSNGEGGGICPSCATRFKPSSDTNPTFSDDLAL